MKHDGKEKLINYSKILYANREKVNFYDVASKLLKDENIYGDDIEKNTIFSTTASLTAPIIISYVIWVIKKSEKQNIKTLYFLARDGYIMYKIAERICREYDLGIKCQYLYCSRYSLRMPLYHKDMDDALEKICSYSMKVSNEGVLERIGLDNGEKQLILSEIGIKEDERKTILTRRGLQELRKRLKYSKVFNELLFEKSKMQYEITIKYLKQTGVFKEDKFAIVDTGWSGSMQKCFKRIFDYEGKGNIDIIGFYFGMIQKPDEKDGQHNNFYFSKTKKLMRSFWFNINLFECMCAANHGMTIGYKQSKNGNIEPILKDYKNTWDVNIQIDTICAFTEMFVKTNNFNGINEECLAKLIQKLVISFMCFPSFDEAVTYGNIKFCDDLSEGYMIKLAQELNRKELKKYAIPIRIYNKLISRRKNKIDKESFWIEGSIVRLNLKYEWIYQLNNNLLNVCKYLQAILKK